MGCVHGHKETFVKMTDRWIPNYYLTHQEDIQNPLHGIKYTLQELMQFNERPSLAYTHGIIFYISLKACEFLVNHLENISWDIFTRDEYGYPYIIEDVGVGYILRKNGILPLNCEEFPNNPDYRPHSMVIGYHTNKDK